METQQSIAQWAEDTFGPAHNTANLVQRAQDELQELFEAVQEGDTPEIGREAADVVILLMRLLELNGLSLEAEVNAKMTTNRARSWSKKGDGTGSHI